MVFGQRDGVEYPNAQAAVGTGTNHPSRLSSGSLPVIHQPTRIASNQNQQPLAMTPKIPTQISSSPAATTAATPWPAAENGHQSRRVRQPPLGGLPKKPRILGQTWSIPRPQTKIPFRGWKQIRQEFRMQLPLPAILPYRATLLAANLHKLISLRNPGSASSINFREFKGARSIVLARNPGRHLAYLSLEAEDGP